MGQHEEVVPPYRPSRSLSLQRDRNICIKHCLEITETNTCPSCIKFLYWINITLRPLNLLMHYCGDKCLITNTFYSKYIHKWQLLKYLTFQDNGALLPQSMVLCLVMLASSLSTSNTPAPGVITTATFPVRSKFLSM